jgi:hypothetical protein
MAVLTGTTHGDAANELMADPSVMSGSSVTATVEDTPKVQTGGKDGCEGSGTPGLNRGRSTPAAAPARVRET